VKPLFIGLILVVLAVIGMAFFYDYCSLWKMLPQGSHLWRQSDSWAMTLNFQQFKLHFLQPATYNLQAENGQVAGEFPLFYFIAAQTKHAGIVLRLMHSFIFISGIIATYFIAYYFLQRSLLSIWISILFFTSPLLVFYGNNFISDIPALSMSFLAWAIFLNQQQKNSALLFAFLFFAFATLLKASQLINYGILFIFLWKTKQLLFKHIILFLTLFIPISWYVYAKHYNTLHHDSYYFLSVFPVWKLSWYELGLGAWRMLVSWSDNYFWRPTSVVIIISCYFVFLHRNKLNQDLKTIIVSSLIFEIIYLVFFYQKMIGHEYYYAVFFIFFLFLIIGILKTYNLFHAENIFAHTALFLLLIPNFIFCVVKTEQKNQDAKYNIILADASFQQYLEKMGIKKLKTVVSLPDDSPNKTLSLIKRKGYTECNNYVKLLKEKKADYLILSDANWKLHPELQPYLVDSIGDFHGITIYQLR